MWMRAEGILMHIGAYGCLTDAYEYTRMHTDAYKQATDTYTDIIHDQFVAEQIADL